MIISLRGASGSGKTTLAREVMSHYARQRFRYMPGRKNPYYVVHGRDAVDAIRSSHLLVTPGHYDIGNGGVDTLRTLDEAYSIARWADNMRYDVLMEGKCMSDGTPHAAKLHEEGRDIRVVHVDTNVNTCCESVHLRGHKIARASIEKTNRKVLANMEQFRCMKIQTFSGSRTECLLQVREWLVLS